MKLFSIKEEEHEERKRPKVNTVSGKTSSNQSSSHRQVMVNRNKSPMSMVLPQIETSNQNSDKKKVRVQALNDGILSINSPTNQI